MTNVTTDLFVIRDGVLYVDWDVAANDYEAEGLPGGDDGDINDPELKKIIDNGDYDRPIWKVGQIDHVTFYKDREYGLQEIRIKVKGRSRSRKFNLADVLGIVPADTLTALRSLWASLAPTQRKLVEEMPF